MEEDKMSVREDIYELYNSNVPTLNEIRKDLVSGKFSEEDNKKITYSI